MDSEAANLKVSQVFASAHPDDYLAQIKRTDVGDLAARPQDASSTTLSRSHPHLVTIAICDMTWQALSR